MYQQHMPLIREHGRTFAGFQDIVTFVLLSIRQPFVTVPDMMVDARAYGEGSPYLWGWKLAGYRAVRGAIGQTAFETVGQALYAQDAIKALLPIPGLGITKSGFVAQMLGFDVGCLDTRNEKRLGIRPRMFRVESDRRSPRLIDRKVGAYVELCQQEGGAEHLWNEWCTDLAEARGLEPTYVSEMHLATIH